MLTRYRHAGGESGDGGIDSARHHRGSGAQAEAGGDGGQEPADDVRGVDQPRGHHEGRDTERGKHLAGPAARRQIVDAADVAGRAVVDRDLAGQALDDVGVGRQQQRRLGPDLRTLVAQPHHFGEAVIGIDQIAGDGTEPIHVDMRADPLNLSLSPPIHPDQARVKWVDVGVDRDAGAAIEARDAEGDDIVPVACNLGDTALHCVEPHIGVLLGPVGTGRVGHVAVLDLGEDGAVGRNQDRLGALSADVDPDDATDLGRHARGPGSEGE